MDPITDLTEFENSFKKIEELMDKTSHDLELQIRKIELQAKIADHQVLMYKLTRMEHEILNEKHALQKEGVDVDFPHCEIGFQNRDEKPVFSSGTQRGRYEKRRFYPEEEIKNPAYPNYRDRHHIRNMKRKELRELSLIPEDAQKSEKPEE